MQGDAKMMESLNMRLAEELTAINQYMVHAEMLENWHYSKLSGPVEKRAIVEMKHAESLIERLLFLEGRPVVSELNKLHIGATVLDMHKNDLDAEHGAVRNYNESIRIAIAAGDAGSKQLLEGILQAEEEHVDWLEAQLDQIAQMGLEFYLAEQIG